MHSQRDVRAAQRRGGAGLERACWALAAGRAVVVPNPAPMSYGIVATRAGVVNELKHRPAGQNVAVSLHDRDQWLALAPTLDLPPELVDSVAVLLRLRVSLLLPLRPQVPTPDWAAPAVRNGRIAAFNGYWDATAPLWQRFSRLFGSSANVTGGPPATTAAQAAAVFGVDCPVVDVDEADHLSGPRLPSTMLRIDRSGRLELHRSGAQDATSHLPPGEFLRRTARTVGLPPPSQEHV